MNDPFQFSARQRVDIERVVSTRSAIARDAREQHPRFVWRPLIAAYRQVVCLRIRVGRALVFVFAADTSLTGLRLIALWKSKRFDIDRRSARVRANIVEPERRVTRARRTVQVADALPILHPMRRVQALDIENLVLVDRLDRQAFRLRRSDQNLGKCHGERRFCHLCHSIRRGAFFDVMCLLSTVPSHQSLSQSFEQKGNLA